MTEATRQSPSCPDGERRFADDVPAGLAGVTRRSADDALELLAHDIRTPLTLIVGHLEILADTPGAIDPLHRARVEVIVRNVSRLCRIIDDTLGCHIPEGRAASMPAGGGDAVAVVDRRAVQEFPRP